MKRCDWPGPDEGYLQYHDDVWGKPVYGERELFAKLQLDLMQAGLSWLTILRKMDDITEAFLGFDIDELAAIDGEGFTEQLLENPKIIRSRKKIEAVLTNAQAAQKLRLEFPAQNQQCAAGLPTFLWRYLDFKSVDNQFKTSDQVPAKTDLSEHIARDLKTHGFTFVGPTIVYAFMQAVGMVNDHLADCAYR